MVAAGAGNVDMVKLILDGGADITVRDKVRAARPRDTALRAWGVQPRFGVRVATPAARLWSR